MQSYDVKSNKMQTLSKDTLKKKEPHRESEQFAVRYNRGVSSTPRQHAENLHFNLDNNMQALLFYLYLHHAVGSTANDGSIFANRRARRMAVHQDEPINLPRDKTRADSAESRGPGIEPINLSPDSVEMPSYIPYDPPLGAVVINEAKLNGPDAWRADALRHMAIAETGRQQEERLAIRQELNQPRGMPPRWMPAASQKKVLSSSAPGHSEQAAVSDTALSVEVTQQTTSKTGQSLRQVALHTDAEDVRLASLNSALRKEEGPVIPPLKHGHFNFLLHQQHTETPPSTGTSISSNDSFLRGVAAARPIPRRLLNSKNKIKSEKKLFRQLIQDLEDSNSGMNFHGGTILVKDRKGVETLHSVFDLPDFRAYEYEVSYDPSYSKVQMDILNNYRAYGITLSAPQTDTNYLKVQGIADLRLKSYIDISKKINSHELNINKFIEHYVQDTINQFNLQKTLTPDTKMTVLYPGDRVGETKSMSISLIDLAAGLHHSIDDSHVFWTPLNLPEGFKNKIIPTGVIRAGYKKPDEGVFTSWEKHLPAVRAEFSSAAMEDFYEMSFLYAAETIIKEYNATKADLIYKFYKREIEPQLIKFSSPIFGECYIKDTIMLKGRADYSIIMNIKGDYDVHFLNSEINSPKLKKMLLEGMPVKLQRTMNKDLLLKKYRPGIPGVLSYANGIISPLQPERVGNYKNRLAKIALEQSEMNMNSIITTHWQAKIPEIIEFSKWFISLGMALFPPTSPLGALGLALVDTSVTIAGGMLKSAFSEVPEKDKSVFYETLIEIGLNRLADIGGSAITASLPDLKTQYRPLLREYFEHKVSVGKAGAGRLPPPPAHHSMPVSAQTKLSFGKDIYRIDPDFLSRSQYSWESVARYQRMTGLIDNPALKTLTQQRIRAFNYIGYLGDSPSLIRSAQDLKKLASGTRLGIVDSDSGYLIHAMLKTEGTMAVGMNNRLIGGEDKWQTLDVAAFLEWKPSGKIQIKSNPNKDYILFSQHGSLKGSGIPENILNDVEYLKRTGGIPKASITQVLDDSSPVVPVVIKDAEPGHFSHEEITITQHNNLIHISTLQNKPDTLLTLSHGSFDDKSGVIRIPQDFQLKFATPHDTVLKAPGAYFFASKQDQFFTQIDDVTGYAISSHKDTAQKVHVPLAELKQKIFPARWQSGFDKILTSSSTKERLLSTGTKEASHIRNYNLENVEDVYQMDKIAQFVDINRFSQNNPVLSMSPEYRFGPMERMDIITVTRNALATTEDIINFAKKNNYQKLKFVHCRIYRNTPPRPKSDKVMYIAETEASRPFGADEYKAVLEGDIEIDFVKRTVTFEVVENIHWLFRWVANQQSLTMISKPLPEPDSAISNANKVKLQLNNKRGDYKVRAFNVYNSTCKTNTRYPLPLSKDLSGSYRVIDLYPVKGFIMGGKFIADNSYKEVNEWMSDFMHQHNNHTLWFSFKDFDSVQSAMNGNLTDAVSLELSHIYSDTAETTSSSTKFDHSAVHEPSAIVDYIDPHLRENPEMMRIMANASRVPRGVPPNNRQSFIEEYKKISAFLQGLGFRTFSREVEYWSYDDENKKSSFSVVMFSDSHNNYVFDPHIQWAVLRSPLPSETISPERDWIRRIFNHLNDIGNGAHFRDIEGQRKGSWSSV